MKLETTCHRIIKERQYQADIQKVEQDHFEHDCESLTAPVLLINEKVYSSARIPERSEIEMWIDGLLKEYFY